MKTLSTLAILAGANYLVGNVLVGFVCTLVLFGVVAGRAMVLVLDAADE